jgi:hypothetical protein
MINIKKLLYIKLLYLVQIPENEKYKFVEGEKGNFIGTQNLKVSERSEGDFLLSCGTKHARFPVKRERPNILT